MILTDACDVCMANTSTMQKLHTCSRWSRFSTQIDTLLRCPIQAASSKVATVVPSVLGEVCAACTRLRS